MSSVSEIETIAIFVMKFVQVSSGQGFSLIISVYCVYDKQAWRGPVSMREISSGI